MIVALLITIVCLLSCFSLFIVAVDNYALSKLDKIELYNNSMIICTILKTTINLNEKYSYNIDTKIRSRIDNHKQQQYHVFNPQHNQQYQQHNYQLFYQFICVIDTSDGSL
jgi:hypothetical protein